MISTTAEILFWPIFAKVFFSHSGLSILLRFLISAIKKLEHNSLFFTSTVKLLLNLLLKLGITGFLSLPIPFAARSLAIPYTPKQSPLLGVIDTSMTGSSFPK